MNLLKVRSSGADIVTTLSVPTKFQTAIGALSTSASNLLSTFLDK